MQIDHWTGLLARPAAVEMLEDKHDGQLLLADIDQFKFVNSVLGHTVGDETLRVIADLARQHLTDSVLCRYGGDEFLAYSQVGGLTAKAEAWRVAVGQRLMSERNETCAGTKEAGIIDPPRDGLLTLTIAVGNRTNASVADDLTRLGAAAHAAKKLGGNRVVEVSS